MTVDEVSVVATTSACLIALTLTDNLHAWLQQYGLFEFQDPALVLVDDRQCVVHNCKQPRQYRYLYTWTQSQDLTEIQQRLDQQRRIRRGAETGLALPQSLRNGLSEVVSVV